MGILDGVMASPAIEAPDVHVNFDAAPAPMAATPASPPAGGKRPKFVKGDKLYGLELAGDNWKDKSQWKPVYGDDFIKSYPDMSSDTAALIKGIANYELPPGSQRGGLGSPEVQQLLSLAKRYDPNFDAKQYKVRQDFLSELNNKSAPNTMGGQLQVMDNASQHALAFDKAAHALHNWDIPYAPASLMSLVNKMASGGNREAQGKADQAQQSYSMEAPKVVMGGTPNEPELNAQREISDPYLPDRYTEGAMKDFAEKMGNRLGSIQTKAKRVWGPGGMPNGTMLISPEGAMAMHMLMRKYNSKADEAMDWKMLTAGGFDPKQIKEIQAPPKPTAGAQQIVIPDEIKGIIAALNAADKTPTNAAKEN
jgi:hypothetical protein